MVVFTIIYEAIKRDLDIHIWVEASENQALWELSKSGINYSAIDESGSLLQNKEIDLVIVGAIGVNERGKTTNRAGTYLKAIGAHENLIPFYVAALELDFGFLDTPKPQEKPFFVKGVDSEGLFREIQTTQDKSKSISYGFDITPAKFITGFITPNEIYKKDFDKISEKLN
jgi:methylthioribose-1-phosphate isomerase